MYGFHNHNDILVHNISSANVELQCVTYLPMNV